VSQGGRTAPGDGAGGDAAARRGWRRGRSRRLRQSERSGGCGEPAGTGCDVFLRHSGAPGGDGLASVLSYDMPFLCIPSDHLSEVARADPTGNAGSKKHDLLGLGKLDTPPGWEPGVRPWEAPHWPDDTISTPNGTPERVCDAP